MNNFPNWADHITGFLFSVALPLLAIMQSPKESPNVVFNSSQKLKIYLSNCFSLFIMAAVIVSVWLLFNRPLTELGLTESITATSSWLWAVVAFALLYALDTVISVSTKKRLAASINDWKKRTPFMPTKKRELPGFFLLCLCAGIFEEVVYRGYLVTYYSYLFESSAARQSLSVVLPALVFSMSHFYQGTKAVIKIFIFSVFFGYIFIQSGSLLIVMLIHLLVNVAGGLLGILYIKEETPQNEVV
jgi:uncharacterized protein